MAGGSHHSGTTKKPRNDHHCLHRALHVDTLALSPFQRRFQFPQNSGQLPPSAPDLSPILLDESTTPPKTPTKPQTTTMAQPNERPPSPYAFKFGTHHYSILNHPPSTLPQPTNRHSGFAPLFPPLDDTFYADPPSHDLISRPVPDKPTAHEIDVIFNTEETQLTYNHGLRTWEITALQGEMANGVPGGHRTEDMQVDYAFDAAGGGGITVDESGWCEIFRKELWYNFRVKVYDGTWLIDGIPGVKKRDWWSVDCEGVWRETRYVDF